MHAIKSIFYCFAVKKSQSYIPVHKFYFPANINRAEHEYMNVHPQVNALASPQPGVKETACYLTERSRYKVVFV